MNTFSARCDFRRTMISNAIQHVFLMLLIVTVTAFTVPALAQDIQKLSPLSINWWGLIPSWRLLNVRGTPRD